MILKEREIPLRFLKVQALERRLPFSHTKKAEVMEEKRRRQAGINGEKALDKYTYTFLDDKYIFIRGLRLPNSKSFFQIDTLLLTPNLILPIEAKNHAGFITLDHNFNQMTQTINDHKYVYDDPLLQVRRQQSQLAKWIQKNTSYTLAFDHLVVFTNSSTSIEINGPSEYYSRTCRLNQLESKLEDLEKLHPVNVATQRTIKSLTKLLLKKHIPEKEYNILNQYQISENDLIKGVQCPKCQRFPMKRISANWVCLSCRHKSKDAHIQAVQDYFLLLNPSITNQECRNFLQLSSANIALNLLSSMDLTCIGAKKGRRYSYNTLPLK